MKRSCDCSLASAQAGDPRVREAPRALTAVRLHGQFSVFDQTPEAWTITPANASERKVFRQNLRPGALSVADRGYGGEYALLTAVRRAGAHFVFRLPNDGIITPQTERPLTPEDRAAGVDWDRVVTTPTSPAPSLPRPPAVAP